MSIRLRLALWYGLLCSLALLAVEVFSYSYHTRGHYDDLDRALITSAGHATAEAITSGAEPHLVAGRGGLEIALRLYDSGGRLRDTLPGVETLPPVNPQAVLAAPAGPAFDKLAGLVPPFLGPPDPGIGAFGLFTLEGQRWRVYVLPIQRDNAPLGYVEALAPLGRLDAAMEAFRYIMAALGLLSVTVGFVGSRLVAGSALRPIARMVQAARTIAHSRDFSRRVAGSTHRDELHELAQAFNGMLASLEEAYRAQQRFVADASHELRAPLTAIQANLELLERRPDMSPTAQEEAVREASRETRRLTRLVADLLVLARADAGLTLRRQRVELEQVLLEAVGETRRLTRGQQVTIEKLETALVQGDPDRLKQLLLILLDNAVKYTPPEGRITVGVQRNKATVEITVKDTGIGVPSEALPHLFERFYRADPARARDPGGTGLGLSIARWIVEQHGGRIALSSEPGQGTTVSVFLPGYPH